MPRQRPQDFHWKFQGLSLLSIFFYFNKGSNETSAHCSLSLSLRVYPASPLVPCAPRQLAQFGSRPLVAPLPPAASAPAMQAEQRYIVPTRAAAAACVRARMHAPLPVTVAVVAACGSHAACQPGGRCKGRQLSSTPASGSAQHLHAEAGICSERVRLDRNWQRKGGLPAGRPPSISLVAPALP